MDIVNSVIAFNLGLFSTLHCLGMCGGISTAMSMSIPEKSTVSKTGIVFAYNIGRIISYSLAGAIAGVIGAGMAASLMPVGGHRVLQFIAAFILVLIGLQISGWFRGLGVLESAGMYLWNYLRPLTRFFFPVSNYYRALMAGMIWGWLPCALVYSVLLWALTIGDALAGAALMFCFGLGTLPGMLIAGITGARFREFFKDPVLKKLAGIIIIVFGISSPFLYNTADHSGHHVSWSDEGSDSPLTACCSSSSMRI